MTAVDADASAPLVVDVPKPHRLSAENAPFEPGARYTGSYWCAQGKTAMTLVVDSVDGDDVSFVFSFDFAGSSSSQAAAGSFLMKGSFDKKVDRLALRPLRWIEQPPGYSMVDLTGNVSRTGGISGVVGGPGCTTFQVTPEKERVN